MKKNYGYSEDIDAPIFIDKVSLSSHNSFVISDDINEIYKIVKSEVLQILNHSDDRAIIINTDEKLSNNFKNPSEKLIKINPFAVYFYYYDDITIYAFEKVDFILTLLKLSSDEKLNKNDEKIIQYSLDDLYDYKIPKNDLTFFEYKLHLNKKYKDYERIDIILKSVEYIISILDNIQNYMHILYDAKNNFTAFDIYNYTLNKTDKLILYLICFEYQIQDYMKNNREKRIRLYLNNIQELLENEITYEYINKIFDMTQFNIIFTYIIKNINFLSPYKMFLNSGYIHITDDKYIPYFTKLFNIDMSISSREVIFFKDMQWRYMNLY